MHRSPARQTQSKGLVPTGAVSGGRPRRARRCTGRGSSACGTPVQQSDANYDITRNGPSARFAGRTICSTSGTPTPASPPARPRASDGRPGWCRPITRRRTVDATDAHSLAGELREHGACTGIINGVTMLLCTVCERKILPNVRTAGKMAHYSRRQGGLVWNARIWSAIYFLSLPCFVPRAEFDADLPSQGAPGN